MNRRRASHLGGLNLLRLYGYELYARRDFRGFGVATSESKFKDVRKFPDVLSLGSFRDAFSML